MKASDMLGYYLPNQGNELCVQDLIDLLMRIPAKARRSSLVTVASGFVIGMSIGQSDQAPDDELKVRLTDNKVFEEVETSE